MARNRTLHPANTTHPHLLNCTIPGDDQSNSVICQSLQLRPTNACISTLRQRGELSSILQRRTRFLSSSHNYDMKRTHWPIINLLWSHPDACKGWDSLVNAEDLQPYQWASFMRTMLCLPQEFRGLGDEADAKRNVASSWGSQRGETMRASATRTWMTVIDGLLSDGLNREEIPVSSVSDNEEDCCSASH